MLIERCIFDCLPLVLSVGYVGFGAAMYNMCIYVYCCIVSVQMSGSICWQVVNGVHC